MSTNYPTVKWAASSNIYEVNIRQYTQEGTFVAFQKHLPRLKDMGVEILWLMPITPISMKERLGTLGSYYACSSYVNINPEFGTLQDFKALVDAVHALDMKIIIDWVANHTGHDHHWTIEHPDWYKKDAAGNFMDTHGWKDVIDLDYENKAMREALMEAMRFWVKDYDIDGFRCDMAHLVPLDFWMEARDFCDAVKPLFWLAETDEDQYLEIFDISYAWRWMHVSEQYVKYIATRGQLMEVLQKYLALPEGAEKLWFTSNHDENSWNGTEYEKYGDGAAAFAVFTCTWPGMPLIYSGQELPNLKRLKFFDKDEIEWNDQIPKLHSFYQKLLDLRKRNSALGSAENLQLLHTAPETEIMAYACSNGNDRVLVLLNLSNEARVKLTLNEIDLSGNYRNVFSGIEYSFKQTENFELQAWEYLVYEKL